METDPTLRTKVSSLIAGLAAVRRRENVGLIRSQMHTAETPRNDFLNTSECLLKVQFRSAVTTDAKIPHPKTANSVVLLGGRKDKQIVT